MPTQYNKYTQDNNTNKATTTIHTVNQQQLHKRQLETSNKTHETITCLNNNLHSSRSILSVIKNGFFYTGCPRRNVPDFWRVFLRSNYTDITRNTYIQSSMVTEILAREKYGFLWCLHSILCRDAIRLTFTATILQ